MFMFPLNDNFDHSDPRVRLLAILDTAGGM
jgi:hypothetical protein